MNLQTQLPASNISNLWVHHTVTTTDYLHHIVYLRTMNSMNLYGDKAIRLETFPQLIIPALAICLISQMAEDLPSLIHRSLKHTLQQI